MTTNNYLQVKFIYCDHYQDGVYSPMLELQQSGNLHVFTHYTALMYV
jgi:hypothetical protein